MEGIGLVERARNYLRERKYGRPSYRIYFEPVSPEDVKRLGLEYIAEENGNIGTFIATNKGYLLRGNGTENLEVRTARIDVEVLESPHECNVDENKRAVLYRKGKDVALIYWTEGALEELGKLITAIEGQVVRLAQEGRA